MTRHARHTLLGTTALSLILAAAPALAQEAGDGFLGTISLGKSKRDVATDTATAVTEIDSREIADRGFPAANLVLASLQNRQLPVVAYAFAEYLMHATD